MIKDKNLRKFMEILSENEFFYEEDGTFGGFLVKLHVIIKAIDEVSDDYEITQDLADVIISTIYHFTKNPVISLEVALNKAVLPKLIEALEKNNFKRKVDSCGINYFSKE